MEKLQQLSDFLDAQIVKLESLRTPLTKEKLMELLSKEPNKYGTVLVMCEGRIFDIDLFIAPDNDQMLCIAGDEAEHYEVEELELLIF